jgi:hypothetical protein
MWHHPIITLVGALVLLVLVILLVRAVWRAIRNLFAGKPRPTPAQASSP